MSAEARQSGEEISRAFQTPGNLNFAVACVMILCRADTLSDKTDPKPEPPEEPHAARPQAPLHRIPRWLPVVRHSSAGDAGELLLCLYHYLRSTPAAGRRHQQCPHIPILRDFALDFVLGNDHAQLQRD